MQLNNTVPQVFVQNQQERRVVDSLRPYLRESLKLGNFMEASQMGNYDQQSCRWVGYGLAKGVSSIDPTTPISVLSTYEDSVSTLHGLMIQGLGETDEYPWCYYPDRKSDRGFGKFIRWAYFTSTDNQADVFAVDFSLNCDERIGKAASIASVSAVAAIAAQHGIPLDAELVLANERMCENFEHSQFRTENNLISVRDWDEAACRCNCALRFNTKFCPVLLFHKAKQ